MVLTVLVISSVPACSSVIVALGHFRLEEQLEQEIREIFGQVFAREVSSENPPVLASSTVLLDTGLDSMGFAVLVVELEEQLGFDPFSIAETPFYPRTFGEFVAFYEQNKPS